MLYDISLLSDIEKDIVRCNNTVEEILKEFESNIITLSILEEIKKIRYVYIEYTGLYKGMKSYLIYINHELSELYTECFLVYVK